MELAAAAGSGWGQEETEEGSKDVAEVCSLVLNLLLREVTPRAGDGDR